MIEVFRPGSSHIVNGITCQRDTVNEFGFEHLLEEGWFLTPEECYPKETPEEPTKESKKSKEIPNKLQEALKVKETPKTADSKVTVPITPVPDKAPKTEKSDKTTTKTAVEK